MNVGRRLRARRLRSAAGSIDSSRHILESRCAERCANNAFSTSFRATLKPTFHSLTTSICQLCASFELWLIICGISENEFTLDLAKYPHRGLCVGPSLGLSNPPPPPRSTSTDLALNWDRYKELTRVRLVPVDLTASHQI